MKDQGEKMNKRERLNSSVLSRFKKLTDKKDVDCLNVFEKSIIREELIKSNRNLEEDEKMSIEEIEKKVEENYLPYKMGDQYIDTPYFTLRENERRNSRTTAKV